jgi:hypothetical protein
MKLIEVVRCMALLHWVSIQGGVKDDGVVSSRLGIPIFGSDFWDPHRKRNSGSVSDSKDSGRKNFNQIPLLKN